MRICLLTVTELCVSHLTQRPAHFITLFHLAAVSFPDLTPVNVLLTHSRSLSSHSLHQTHSVPVLNLITQSIAISASVSHYKHYYSSSWSVPLVSALSNDVCGPFCSSTNHSCWNGEKSLEARGNNSEKWSNSGARYKSEPHRSRTEGHKHFFSSGLPWERTPYRVELLWHRSVSHRHCPETLLQFSALPLLFVFISNWKRRKGEATCYLTFCLSADSGSFADVGMESVREAEIEKYSKPWTCTLMCVTVKLSAETAGKTAYLLKRRGTVEQKEKELRKFPQL